MPVVNAEPVPRPRAEGLISVELINARKDHACEAHFCMMGSRAIATGSLYVRLHGAAEANDRPYPLRAHAGCLHIGLDERIDAAIRAAGPHALQRVG